MIKKYKYILFWIVITAYSLITLGFSAIKREQVVCSNIEVIITDNTDNYFVEKEDVISMFLSKGIALEGVNINKINVNELEKILNNDPSIKNSQVYTRIDGSVIIEVEQRNPIVRVINRKNESYYIDEQGEIMPLSPKYTAHVLIANGNINESQDLLYSTNITSLSDKDVIGRRYVIKDIYNIALHVYNNEFWKSMIEQIYVNINNDLELIPRVGNHTVIFGTAEDMYEKFRKLKVVYKLGLKQSGWNKYTTINLKYKNQVVCTKKPLL
ncbi:MAG: hypothetical protein A2W91_06095 [Bacteroidetes bacterium GWF2_38_335]|nr:MAG: hypothetical protein A2W91_06095 [Bacteroidetes bacterium GWF2_38_335]OFY79678.1 MAG: hypothetical protein A2281_09585 [Bacteroidetes bacterium RIFOXYA12_FULL_38_20]HBS88998.1 hypothetical protein [Bacteroidales bacterium]